MRRISLKQRYLEAISSQVISLSLSNISKFYSKYIKENKSKVESELNRVGYFVLKNKISIGNDSSTTKDVYISTFFVNMDMEIECDRMLDQRYHGGVSVKTTDGFFVPSTNELVVIVRVFNTSNIERDLQDADIRSTIEHEITHAFDHTNKNQKLSKQRSIPGIGESFLSMCSYLGCADREDLMDIVSSDIFNDGFTSRCVYSISMILYKLFTLTEFNAHQMSDLKELHNIDIKKSYKVRDALRKDVIQDYILTANHLKYATEITPEQLPSLWNLVGNVLSYMGYNVNTSSPESVYKYFKRESEKLFNKYINRKRKNQSKIIVSLREKENIKSKLISGVKLDSLEKGISFWFSPTGNRDSYLCRVYASNGKLNFTINNKQVKFSGNADSIFKRLMDYYNNNDTSKFEFAVDNLVDIIVQTIERNFNNVLYDPVYDITTPQDEIQISQSNKRDSRFADLDW